MFRETHSTASKIIELIQTLPEKEQKMIADKLSSSKKKSKKTSAPNGEYLKKIEIFQNYVEKHRFKVPKNYRFDREEANSR
jgi:hypothetical protein